MSPLNPCCNRWKEKTLTMQLPIVKSMPDQTSKQEDFGDPTINVHFLTLRYLTLTHSQIDGQLLNPATNEKKRRRSAAMNKESWRLSTALSLHLCLVPLGAWEGLRRLSLLDWLLSWQTNDRPSMPQQWD